MYEFMLRSYLFINLGNRCDAMLHFIPQLVEKKSFKSPKEFREESQWIFHNAIIYFGGNKKNTVNINQSSQNK